MYDFHYLNKGSTPTNSEINVKFRGRKVYFSAPFWFLHSLQEIFVEDIYKFEPSNAELNILDCGANVGMSIIYLKELFPNSKIKAFEPDPFVFRQLQKNINEFQLKNVEIINRAIWTEQKTLTFQSDGSLGGKITDEKQGNKNIINVQAVRLKDFIKEKIYFLKMDIEGAEYEVIKDIKEDLHLIENLFIEYHSNAEEQHHLIEMLSWINDAGFRFYIKEAWNNMPHPFTQKNKGGYQLQLNIFCYRGK